MFKQQINKMLICLRLKYGILVTTSTLKKGRSEARPFDRPRADTRTRPRVRVRQLHLPYLLSLGRQIQALGKV